LGHARRIVTTTHPTRVIPRNDVDCPIVNTEHLPRGGGCRYLECYDDRDTHGTLIASKWRRTVPARLPARYVLIDYSPTTPTKSKP
jgi:hypothetical protein